MFLAERKGTDLTFAVKALSKDSILKGGSLDMLILERKVLAMCAAHPFMKQLYSTFQSPVSVTSLLLSMGSMGSRSYSNNHSPQQLT